MSLENKSLSASMLREHLMHVLEPDQLSVEDHSQAHIGHQGASRGAGHFSVKVVSRLFEGKSLVERHRMIYQALDGFLEEDIHALQIEAKTPVEVS